MKKIVLVLSACLAVCSCSSAPDGVMNKVLVDFGLRAQPEGHTSGTDRVFERLDAVGQAEMKRMNLAEQHGSIKFQRQNELRGKFYREVKVYESFYPTDARPVSRTAGRDGGHHGYIEFAYRLHQSARKNTRAEAAAETASIPTDETGREMFRYTFGSSGNWDGSKGARAKR